MFSISATVSPRAAPIAAPEKSVSYCDDRDGGLQAYNHLPVVQCKMHTSHLDWVLVSDRAGYQRNSRRIAVAPMWSRGADLGYKW
jgi:hypothetical protein